MDAKVNCSIQIDKRHQTFATSIQIVQFKLPKLARADLDKLLLFSARRRVIIAKSRSIGTFLQVGNGSLLPKGKYLEWPEAQHAGRLPGKRGGRRRGLNITLEDGTYWSSETKAVQRFTNRRCWACNKTIGFWCCNSGNFNEFDDTSCVCNRHIELVIFFYRGPIYGWIFVYLQFIDVSKHSVYGALNGVDELQTKLYPIVFVKRSLGSTASQTGQLRHARCPRRSQARVRSHFVPIDQRKKMPLNRSLGCWRAAVGMILLEF